ncbi:calmin isoform X5 [Anolis carolinensis]|uniref:calmin isoform X5 n=1 Tax=Anolis carolinensis TaxID=28377 RepID=UPI0004625F12|nr:PREDICTED: calmin isoform X3 [Anolis carolinensis]|eukprot:XP_008106320.1 PREDICTED: calmin isoform X3 [Anolis carolinensis]
MAGSEWDWFQREELIGQITDLRVQNLQVERENVQKRTFTRWINLHLEKCSPPLEVKDLLVDIKDGKILMALLEVLSGQNLLHEYKPSTHRIFRLNNIAKALKFLEDSNVKLVSIDAAEIADGNSSMVLGLIWNIILFFQIKELTGNLNRNSSSSSLSSGPSGPDSDTSHPNTPNVEKNMSVGVKDQRKAIKAILTWVQRKTRKYGVAVQDFASSWRSGLAFLAVIKAIDPNLVDMKQALEKTSLENLEDAFTIAQDYLGIPRLLEPEDIMVESPDEQSIVTYVAQFLEHFPELEREDFSDPDKEFPVESTYVHVKESPGDEIQGKVLILNENGEHTYTPVLNRSHSPPPKIHILSLPLDQENQERNDNQDHSLSNHPETLRGELQRPSSLPITEPIGFQTGPNADILTKNVNRSEGNQRRMSEPLTHNEDHSPTILMYRTHSLEPVETEESKSTSETKETPERRTRSLPWTSNSPKNIREHQTKDLEHPILDSQEEESAHKYVLQMLHEEISKFPENHEHAKQVADKNKMPNSCQEIDEPDFSDTSEASCPSECFSLPIRNTPKSLDITSEDVPIVVNEFDTAAEERKPPEEKSKKKEKRKNKAILQGENPQSPKACSTRLLDKQEDEPMDHQGLSRISHSDPNVVFQRYVSDSTCKENGGADLQMSTAASESTNPSIRKRKDTEKKESPEKSSSHITSSRTDQPELFYFIIFLWILVYCLMLLPQLVSSTH